MIVDLHVDLEPGAGENSDATAFFAEAKRSGLDGVVCTSTDGAFPETGPLKEAAAEQGITLFSGTTVESNHGLLLCIVPDPTKAFDGEWATKDEGHFDAASVIDAVEERGGVSIALRPYDRDLERPMGDHIFTLQGLAACDVQNGRIPVNANSLALEAANNLEMPCVGSSSAKGSDGLGTAATLFRAALKTEEELVEALRHGECWPVAFSAEAPKPEASRGRRPAGRRGGDSGRERGERSDRGDRGDRGERRGRRGGRGRGGAGAGGGGGRSGGGRSGGGGGGGRGRQPPSDDYGNRLPRAGGRGADEDIGNRVRTEAEAPLPSEDIGNRLAPGEVSHTRSSRDEEG